MGGNGFSDSDGKKFRKSEQSVQRTDSEFVERSFSGLGRAPMKKEKKLPAQDTSELAIN